MCVVKLLKSHFFYKERYNGPIPHIFHTILSDGKEKNFLRKTGDQIRLLLIYLKP